MTVQGAQGHVHDARNDAVLVYVNGQMVPRAEARISVFDSGFILGDGVWEAFRLVDRVLVFMAEHLARLAEGARAIDLDVGLTDGDLAAVGDGRRTIGELIERDPRARFVAATYLRRFATRRNEVLAAGEELKLVEAGNHAQGCVFRDGMKFCAPELERCIDEISQRLIGFFIGRYDIRFANEADLRAGSNFQIIELNGAASEATSIYDSLNSVCCRLSNVVSPMGFGLRHRRSESGTRLRPHQAVARLAEMARVFPDGRNVSVNRLNWAMCTVTFIAQRNGYCLGMNRDEKLTRADGLPPTRTGPCRR